nr:class I SAM-dependent methyltransferase [Paenibacillus roseus]
MLIYKHRDWDHAHEEVNKLVSWMKLVQEADLLDVGCGMGRHSLALADLGFRVTGFDLSVKLLDEARRKDEQAKVRFIHGDMRELPFGDGEFDVTVNLFTSFGYFNEEKDNLQVLRELRRVLRPNGRFVIDYLNPCYVRDHLVHQSIRQDDEAGCTIIETREADEHWVKKHIELRFEHEVRHYFEQVRLYPVAWFEKALSGAGLELTDICGDYDGAAYDELKSKRLIMAGKVRI